MSNITDYGVYAADKAPTAQRLSPSSSDTQSHYITVLVMALLSGKVALKVRLSSSEIQCRWLSCGGIDNLLLLIP